MANANTREHAWIHELIRTADAGDGAAGSELFAVLYRELHAIAERQLRREGSQLTLGTTTLLPPPCARSTSPRGSAAARAGPSLANALATVLVVKRR